MKNKLSFFIDSLGGGGAERVLSVLCTELAGRCYDIDIVMLHKRPVAYPLPDSVHLLYAEEMPVTAKWHRFLRKAFALWNKIRFRVYIPALRRLGYWNYAKANETSWHFYVTYALPYREYLKKEKPDAALGFLIRSNISLLMAARGTDTRVIFCERNHPVRPDMPPNIIRIRDRITARCDAAVFQTEEERAYYTWIRGGTAVIPNPIKENLPARYEGVRRHEIVSFCRLNVQKNIPLMIDAFSRLLNDYPDYTLRIYGRGEERAHLEEYIAEKNLQSAVFLEDFASDVHVRIRDAAMYVSTSDFEGLSNAMLEAMAIGLPCVCTDCDGGGARMMIRDHESGLLVPAGDVEAVYRGMREVLENETLAETLSRNAAKVREQLSISRIADQWEAMLFDKENFDGRSAMENEN